MAKWPLHLAIQGHELLPSVAPLSPRIIEDPAFILQMRKEEYQGTSLIS